MVTWNPVPHIQHAWSDAKTAWGKIGLVLFYTFIWLNIISAVWSIIDPKSQGMSCVVDQVGGHKTTSTMMFAMLRAINVFALGFFLYADVGGLKVKNVAMVFIFITAFMLSFRPVASIVSAGGCGNAMAQMWVLPGWALVALVFAIMEEKRGDHGTAEEHQSLVV